MFAWVVPLIATGLLTTTATGDKINNTPFPKDFLFGTSTAAYQIEGAWNTHGKGEINWDRFISANPALIPDNATAKVACDSYHRYLEDVEQLKQSGSQFYRMSIAWSRILPHGFTNKINEEGVQYYKRLFAELNRNNIVPFVTIYHFDTPQAIEDLGGWTNSDIVTWYGDYARLLFRLFGDDVKYWMTVNEPKQSCHFGYGTGFFAPGTKSPGVGEYECVKNIIMAHATAWRIYDEEFRSTQNGQVGVVIDTVWYEPDNVTEVSSVLASEFMMHFTYGLYANPIVFGDFPDVVKERVARRSAAQGFPRSRLPVFTEEEQRLVKGTFDFLGLNYYSTLMIRRDPNADPHGKGYDGDNEVFTYFDDSWPMPAKKNMRVVPWGMRKCLKWIQRVYGNPPVYITENGYPGNRTLDDVERIDFIQSHLSSVKDAMDIDGANVKGYSYWSIMDNFEWRFGYSVTFGLFDVDFETQNRTARKSLEYYRKVISTRCLVEKCQDSVGDNSL
ncbi:unnamed protein product [Phyllotreta striolata]|uniref:Glycoside hydrolase family 1 n=1 Tax=Phyllotreta striolata TaxID=444603 RepID=A0A9N9XMB7_PHYSR|nr:unnamed protein product [Phyllotreta striolata]